LAEKARGFIDASVYVAAARSPTGGSSLVLEMIKAHPSYRGVASRLVLLEAERNIQAKFGEDELARFYRSLAEVDPEMVQTPPVDSLGVASALVGEGDAHVLAAALAANCDFLATLDRAAFLTERVLNAALPLLPLTPGDFLNEVLGRR
jgi:predicted nucleic acid-binding protein